MSASLSNSRLPSSRNFDSIKDSMLQSAELPLAELPLAELPLAELPLAELPLAEVLDDNQWQDIFDAHEIDFASDEDVAELRRQRSDATNLELRRDTAVARQQLAVGKRDSD